MSGKFLKGFLAVTATASLALAIVATITGPAPTATVGVFYNSGCQFNFGVPPYTFTIISGALPGGLNINSSTCAITGTPNTPGVFNFTIQVVDTPPAVSEALRGSKLAGPSTLTSSSPFTITVTGGGATGAPAMSNFVLLTLAAGLAAMGGLLVKKHA